MFKIIYSHLFINYLFMHLFSFLYSYIIYIYLFEIILD